MKQNRVFILILAIAMAASLALWSGSQYVVQAQGQQPHMEAALHHLREAREELKVAEHNKGGHRDNAIKLVDQAVAEVDAGIHYADKH
jgi:hypothetical protein